MSEEQALINWKFTEESKDFNKLYLEASDEDIEL